MRPGSAAALAAGLLVVAGCSTAAPPLPDGPFPSPPANDQVLASLVLVGDPGDAYPGRSPLLERVTGEVRDLRGTNRETWVVFLGDLVYPLGVRPPGHPDHARDTTILHAQVETLLDRSGEPTGATGVWVPGNHDWGQTIGEAGRARWAETVAVVDRWSEAGIPALVRPRDGSLQTATFPVTADHRLAFIDTQAWLAATPEGLDAAAEMLGRPDSTHRSLVVLAHHPLRTGGSHGSGRPLTSPLGILARAGAVVQDVQAAPYQRMIEAIDAALTDGRPLLWANGHDHNAQLFDRRARSSGPMWELTTGSGSKSSEVVAVEDQVLGGPWPSYATVDLLAGGAAHLAVYGGDPGALTCPESPDDARRRCVREGARSFRLLYAARLHPASEAPQ